MDYSVAATADIAYHYEAATGDLTKIAGPGTDLTFTYDAGGRIATEGFSATGEAFWYGYTAAGQRCNLETAQATGVFYDYDGQGRLTRMENAGNAYGMAEWFYDDATGRLTKQVARDYDTGLKHLETAYGFDATGRLTRVGNQGYDSGGSPRDAVAVGYLFNTVGNVTKVILDDNASAWLAYQYDSLDRLTREERSGTAFNYLNEFSYDAAGNRTKLAYTQGGNTDTTIYLYDDNYRLTKSTLDAVDTTYLWDAAGNLTHKAESGADTWEYLWDARDKLTKVRKQPNGGAMADVASYTYDAQGRRFQKTAGGAITTYYQDGLTPVVETTTGLTKLHRATPGALGNVAQTDDGASTVFYAYDRLGNVLATFDTAGALAAQPVMDAFGNVLSGARADFGLTTKQYDEDIELYYFNARWYEPSLGTFVSADEHPSWREKRYILCKSRPIDCTDPSGKAELPSLTLVYGLACALFNTELNPLFPWDPIHDIYIWDEPVQDCIYRMCSTPIGIQANYNGGKCCEPPKPYGYSYCDLNIDKKCGTPDISHNGACVVCLCESNFLPGWPATAENLARTLIHELAHCCGMPGNHGPRIDTN